MRIFPLTMPLVWMISLCICIAGTLDISAATYTVNVAADTEDASIGDGICSDADGNCSLRAALQEAGADETPDRIEFEVFGTINLVSPLPVINTPMELISSTIQIWFFTIHSVRVRSPHSPLFIISDTHDVTIEGMDLSSSDLNSSTGYGISIAQSTNIRIADNTIRNRERAVHANGVCQLEVTGNNVQDSGDASWDGAIHVQSLCSGVDESKLRIADNDMGRRRTEGVSGIQIVNADNLEINGGNSASGHVSMRNLGAVDFPLRLIEVSDSKVEGVDFSYGNSGQVGIGLRLLDCNGIQVDNVQLRNREVAMQVTGGSGIGVAQSDFSGSGSSEDYACLLIEDFDGGSDASMDIRYNTWPSDAQTLLNLRTCDQIFIGNDELLECHIALPSVIRNPNAIRIQASDNIHVEGLHFLRSDNIIGTEGIIVQEHSVRVDVVNCLFQGYASGIVLEDADGGNISCNTFMRNNNGVWLFNNSSCSLDANSYLCNGVGINSYSSTVINSLSDYWGETGGSSSLTGLGDHFSGLVNAESWSAAEPECLINEAELTCGTEICDNNIDDDGDGLVDCEDASCMGLPTCIGLPEDMRVVMYPNPAVDRLNYATDETVRTVVIKNTNGVVMKRYDMSVLSSEPLDISGMESGIYIVEFITDAGVESQLLQCVK